MVATIAVKQSTLQLLAKVKKKTEASSMDEAIQMLLQKFEHVPSSRFGSQPRLSKFDERDRMKAHEL
ncbi:hypothetical protein HYV80_03395 [Candidatus Woesearchaeota archaeon]|nr:hypothetical protein [Candidatus Woesearchaeota archaeon]